MSKLYSILAGLCDERGISPYIMCKDTGIQPSVMTDLKMGRRHTVKAETASKLANYFGVSVDYLLGNTDKKEKAPAEEGGGITDEELKFALFDAPEEITDDIMDEVKRFAKYVEEQRRNGHIK